MFYQLMKAQQDQVGKPSPAKKEEEPVSREKQLQEELAKLEKEEEVDMPMDNIIESQKRLTEKYLLQKSGAESLGEIKQLILRNENLYHFDDTDDLLMDQLPALEFLSISHNKLTLVNGISKLINLVELNINFNLVEDITPLNECLNLEKLYASNNKIRTISGIRDLTRLKCLGLYKNRLANFEETIIVLSSFKSLQELDLEGNPCSRKFNYKYDILSHIKVQQLDGERIRDIDYELAKSFKKDNPKFYSENQEEEKTEKVLKRPGTAPGRVTKRNFVDKMLTEINSVNKNPLLNIPENVNNEKLSNLEQENEVLREKLNAREVELEESRGRERMMKLEIEQLQNQISILKVEAKDAYILMDNNQQLTKELHSLKTVLNPKHDKHDSAQDNLLLQDQIIELLRENNELKAKFETRFRGPSPKVILKRKASQGKPVEENTAMRPIRVKMQIAGPGKQSLPRRQPPRRKANDIEPSEQDIEELLRRTSQQISSIRSELKTFQTDMTRSSTQYNEEHEMTDTSIQTETPI